MYTKILKMFKGARSYILKDRTARPKVVVCFPLFFIAEKKGGSSSTVKTCVQEGIT